jgi:predicted small secreted protein
MKKISMLLVLLAFSLNACAQEGFGDEIRVFASEAGASASLYALSYSIEKNILSGQEIISLVEEGGGDVSGLQALVDELKTLRDELKEINPKRGYEAAKAYSDIRFDATYLSKEFRILTGQYFTRGEAQKIRESLNQKNMAALQELRAQVNERVRAHNMEKLGEILSAAGVDDEILERYGREQATTAEIKKHLIKSIKSMDADERENAKINLREIYVKSNVFQKAAMNSIAANQMQRVHERLEKRLQRAYEAGANPKAIQNIEARIQKLENSIVAKRISQARTDEVSKPDPEAVIKRLEELKAHGNLTDEDDEKIKDKIREILDNKPGHAKAAGPASGRGIR